MIKSTRRWGPLNLAEAEDLIQETFVRLCAEEFNALRTCRAREPAAVFGLIQAVAATTVVDRYRASHAGKRGGSVRLTALEDNAYRVSDANAHHLLERTLLIRQIDGYIRTIYGEEGERDRQIFWLYFRHGFTAKDIAAIPRLNLTAKGVESVVHRITSSIREKIGGKSAKNPKGIDA